MNRAKFIGLIALLLLSFGSLAEEQKAPSLNTVQLQMTSEAWVKTNTAKVIIAIDATLNQEQLANIHSQILANLRKISDKTDWHIMQFERSKDQSNLERLQVVAEARISETELAQISKRVEAVNKPGVAYRVANIEFTPSLAEIEQVRAELRNNLYEQIKAELANLNKIYPEVHYFVHNVTFKEDMNSVINRSKTMLLAISNVPQIEGQALQVSNQLRLAADVVLAAKFADK